MRVLHFLKSNAYSGAENVVITIILKMSEIYGVDGIYVSRSGKIDAVLESKNVKHAIVRENSIFEYQRIVDEYCPDVIHAHDFSASVLVSFIRTSAKIISHLHNNPPWIKKINAKTLVYQFATRRFDCVLGVSESVFDEYIFSHKIFKKKYCVGNPVDIKRICKAAEEASEYDKSDVLFLGRLTQQKNPLRFIVLMNKLNEKLGSLKAIMVGEGHLKEETNSLIRTFGLEKHIKMLGFKENPYGYLKNTKVLCVPSEWEGFGLVVIEAFSLGIPVVATPVGGMKTLVTNDGGLLTNNDEEFVNELYKLLTDKNYYEIKSTFAYKRAEELDNIEQYIHNIHSIYDIDS